MHAWVAGQARDRGSRRVEASTGASATRSEPAAAQWQRELVDVVQRREAVDEHAPAGEPRATGAGLPARLRAGIESLSGVAMDAVRVHRDSGRARQVHAHAYTQGHDIHVAPGQERHLPHEAWHVVQQAQGRVQPTRRLGPGVPVNDDPALEREADVMGARALTAPLTAAPLRSPGVSADVAQRYSESVDLPGYRFSTNEQFATGADGKELYARKLAVSQANVALRKAGALTLLQCTDEIIPGLYSVVPVINARAVKSRIWQRMAGRQPAAQGGAPGGFRSFADCFRTAGTVGGVDPESAREPAMTLDLPTGTVPVLDLQAGRAYGATSLASRAAASFFLHALPLHSLTLAALPLPSDAERTIMTLLARFGRLDGAGKITAGHAAYKAILADATARDRFVAQFGINGAAAPVIGTMLTQYNDPVEKDTLGGDRWNFHWAGVVLTDGSDYVTLENCAVELRDATTAEMVENADIYIDNVDPIHRGVRVQRDTKQDMLNDRWYFKLYGTAAQSFHTQMLADPHSTPSALTVPLRKVVPPA